MGRYTRKKRGEISLEVFYSLVPGSSNGSGEGKSQGGGGGGAKLTFKPQPVYLGAFDWFLPLTKLSISRILAIGSFLSRPYLSLSL